MNKFLEETELNTKLPKWMEEILEFKSKFREVDIKKSCLIVVDMQDEFLTSEGLLPVWGGRAIIPRLKNLIGLFRNQEQPVIYTKHSYSIPEIDGGTTAEWWKLTRNSLLLRTDSPNTRINKELAPLKGEYIINKQRYSGFFNTNLDALVGRFGVRDIVIAGVASNCCCEATAHDALFRNFHVFFLADGTGGSDELAHISVLRDIAWTYGTVLTVADLTNKFNKGGK